ncbi:MAG: hypothetical protein A3F10_04530 [Coxiella sp. RIFCSPHIGHO2_12_FULL_42_15]|nr:MAG: hypothetical protein A3F10_04530 [Coxiella sp. RIFCSPHIGHO2_12_FULL_42_15]
MSENKPKRLYRSPNERVIAGVCGGIAEYFNVEPTWIRLIFLVFLLAFGATLVIYIILWIIVPLKPKQPNPVSSSQEQDP